MQPVVVLKIVKPLAGDAMASRSAVVILGGKKPFVVLDTSNIAEGCGSAPVSLIPMP
jgi:hypothetical protein